LSRFVIAGSTRNPGVRAPSGLRLEAAMTAIQHWIELRQYFSSSCTTD
jgi:hypothetical protein